MIARREFITLLGGAAAAWPIAARGQQAAMPVVGFLDIRSPQAMTDRLRGFRQGLRDTGYVEDDNVKILYRWADNKIERVQELTAELVRRQVAVIYAGGSTAVVLTAKAATTSIPIIFVVPEDPVRLGLVAAIARPGDNLTGINFLNTELVAKQLAILHEMVPRAVRVAVFVNPANVPTLQATERDAHPAAAPWGCKCRCSQSAQAGKSILRFQHLHASRPMLSLSAPMAFSIADASNSFNRPRTIGCPLSIQDANFPR
jgi:putative tryptophan/tyrosine transport system substrate-binding protein